MAGSGKVRRFEEIRNLQEGTMFCSGSTLSTFLFSFYFFIVLLESEYAALLVVVVVLFFLIHSFYVLSCVNRREVIAILRTGLRLILLVYRLNKTLSVQFAA